MSSVKLRNQTPTSPRLITDDEFANTLARKKSVSNFTISHPLLFQYGISASTAPVSSLFKQKTSFNYPQVDINNNLTEESNFCDELWEKAAEYRDIALNSNYIQELKLGILDPNIYGQYTVQDAIYCYQATRALELAIDKAKDGDEKDFFQGRYEKYKSYTQAICGQWRIKDKDAIDLSEEVSKYIKHQLEVTDKYGDPIYLMIAMLPCNRLWPWLAKEISTNGSSEQVDNVYKFWIEDNLKSTSYIKVQNFINDILKFEPERIDISIAEEVYLRSMRYECNFFLGSDKQDLLPSPRPSKEADEERILGNTLVI